MEAKLVGQPLGVIFKLELEDRGGTNGTKSGRRGTGGGRMVPLREELALGAEESVQAGWAWQGR